MRARRTRGGPAGGWTPRWTPPCNRRCLSATAQGPASCVLRAAHHNHTSGTGPPATSSQRRSTIRNECACRYAPVQLSSLLPPLLDRPRAACSSMACAGLGAHRAAQRRSRRWGRLQWPIPQMAGLLSASQPRLFVPPAPMSSSRLCCPSATRIRSTGPRRCPHTRCPLRHPVPVRCAHCRGTHG